MGSRRTISCCLLVASSSLKSVTSMRTLQHPVPNAAGVATQPRHGYSIDEFATVPRACSYDTRQGRSPSISMVMEWVGEQRFLQHHPPEQHGGNFACNCTKESV
eukprot:399367-Amphidinium_carterae.1